MKLTNLIWFGVLLFLIGCKSEPNTITAIVKPVKEGVYASGHIFNNNQHVITLQKNGVLKQKLITEGSFFKAGENILIFDDGLTNPRLSVALKNLAISKQNQGSSSNILSQLSNQLQISKEKQALDAVNVGRFKRLFEQNATSKLQLDNATLAYTRSLKEYTSLKNQIAQTKNELGLAYKNAESQLELLQSELNFLKITAPFDGYLLETNKEVGEFCRAGEAVATVGGDDGYYCQLKIDEQDIQRVKIGQQVIVTADAFPDEILQAEITSVFPKVNTRDQSLRVDAKLVSKLPIHFSGLSIEANIIVRQSEQALIIPTSYLLPGDSLMVVNKNGEAIKTHVTTGIKTIEEIEITAGIDAETKITLP
jgi:HlyD family secretion protein